MVLFAFPQLAHTHSSHGLLPAATRCCCPLLPAAVAACCCLLAACCSLLPTAAAAVPQVLDRPIFDDASPLKRPWPPKHGERSARDALEAAEEEKAAAEAVEASAADAAANVGLNKSPVRPARKAWATADGGGEAGSGEAGGGGDGAPIDGLGGGGGAPSQSIGDGDRSGQGTSSVATVAHTAASPPVASPPPIRRLRHEGLRVLLCGWRRDVKDMLLLMEQVLPPGSTVRILSERPPAFVDEYLADHCSTFTRVTVRRGRRTLLNL